MGKAVENNSAKVVAAGKAPAKQLMPKAKKVAAKTLEAQADAVVAEVLKVKKTVAKAKPSASAAAASVGAKKTKPVAKKVTKGKNGATGHPAAARGRDKLHIPKEISRRFLRRAGNVRVSDSVLGPLDEVSHETNDDMMLMCVRAAVLAGRSTVQTKDVKRALEILGVHVY